jgi:hypothetical protein
MSLQGIADVLAHVQAHPQVFILLVIANYANQHGVSHDDDVRSGGRPLHQSSEFGVAI